MNSATQPRVRVTLMLARGDQILLEAEPRPDGTRQYALPSRELEAGETLAASAAAIAEAAVDGTLVNLMFQRVLLQPAADATSEVVLGVYGEVIPAGPDPLKGAPPAPRSASCCFFDRNELPSQLSAASALALLACREQRMVIDLDAKPLAVGYGIASTQGVSPEPRRFDMPWRAALAGASTSAWAMATLVGLRQRLSDSQWGWGELTQYALLACAACATCWMTQRRPSTGSAADRFARNAAAILVALGAAWLLAVVGSAFGSGDPAHSTFWVGALGALLTAAALPKLRGLSLAVWASALFLSTSVTLPPLGDALYGRQYDDRPMVPVAQVLDDD